MVDVSDIMQPRGDVVQPDCPGYLLVLLSTIKISDALEDSLDIVRD